MPGRMFRPRARLCPTFAADARRRRIPSRRAGESPAAAVCKAQHQAPFMLPRFFVAAPLSPLPAARIRSFSVRRGRSPQPCLSARRTETPTGGTDPTVPLPPSPHFSVGLLRPRPQKRRCPRGKALPKPLSTPFTVRPSLSLLHLVPASSVQRAFPISLHSPPPLRASGPVSHAQERAALLPFSRHRPAPDAPASPPPLTTSPARKKRPVPLPVPVFF